MREQRKQDNQARWHVLLETRIEACGGPGEVASRLCSAYGKTGQKDFETARRNLANWQTGRSLPQARNFRILTKILEIEADHSLHRSWNAAFNHARTHSSRRDPSAPAWQRLWPPNWRAVVPLVGISLFVVVAVAILPIPSGADDRTIGYLPFAELKVGESVLVHAKRGECGKAPPHWREILHEIPLLKTGRLVDDGLGLSRSTTCGGVTPGRLVRFVAETPGEEEFDLFQRRLKVVVKE